MWAQRQLKLLRYCFMRGAIDRLQPWVLSVLLHVHAWQRHGTLQGV